MRQDVDTGRVVVRTSNWCAVVEAPDFAPLTRHDAAFAQELGDAVVRAGDDDAVKVILLRASGPDFAPVAPVDPVPAGEVLTSWHRDFAGPTAVYQALCFSKKIVLTEVAGQCHGAGSALALCSDLTVAAESARFGSPFALPEANFVLAALTMRLNRAKSWMLLDSVLDAEEAEACGLVNQVVPDRELAGTAEGVARSASGMPLDGVTMSKMLMQSVLDAHGVGREFDLADEYAIHHGVAWHDDAAGGRP